MKRKSVKDQKIEGLIRKLLIEIGEDPNREGLQGTPDRVCRMFKEVFRGYDPKQKPKITTFDNGKDGIIYDNMVVDSGDFVSKCEHHMVFFWGKYWFAYIPNPRGKILGLSKIARVVDYCSARLQLQERLVHDIVEMLKEALGEEYPPLGIALVMKAHHGCFDDKTEILTNRGFVYFRDLKESDLVAQYDRETEKISFTKPYEYIKYHYKGKMVKITHKCTDLLVTPDHRMLFKTEWNGYHTDKKYEFCHAEELVGKRGILPKAGHFDGEDKDITIGDRTFTAKEFCQLMGLYLSEGYSAEAHRTGIVVITQDKKSWAYEEIKAIANNLGFKEHIQSKKEGETLVQFTMYSKTLVEYLSKFGKTAEKYIPQEIKTMSEESRKEFLHCYFLGDGFQHKEDKYRQITTVSRRMANDLQEMLSLCGVSAGIFSRKGGVAFDVIMHKQTNEDKPKDYCTLAAEQTSMEDYDGDVFCVNVEKEAIVVRRNDKVTITGNCKEFRGIKKKGVMTASYLEGAFREDTDVRAEFMELVNSNVYE